MGNPQRVRLSQVVSKLITFDLAFKDLSLYDELVDAVRRAQKRGAAVLVGSTDFHGENRRSLRG